MCIHTGTTVSQANHSRMYTTEIFCRLLSADTEICSVALINPTRRTHLIAHRHALLIVEPLCNTLELVAPPKFSSFIPMRSEKNIAASSLLRSRSCTIIAFVVLHNINWKYDTSSHLPNFRPTSLTVPRSSNPRLAQNLIVPSFSEVTLAVHARHFSRRDALPPIPECSDGGYSSAHQ